MVEYMQVDRLWILAEFEHSFKKEEEEGGEGTGRGRGMIVPLGAIKDRMEGLTRVPVPRA